MHQRERFQNNYDFLRIVAAVCIILFHSFGLLGRSAEEPLARISGGKMNFAFVGLCLFFCISGFLIAKSAVKSVSILSYLWKRFLRIQPLLVVTCICTVFILGPAFTHLSLKAYFSDSHTYSYFRNVLPMFGLQFTLPGVFTRLPEKGVNGSLWTLIVEERMYILLTVLFLYKKDKAVYFVILIFLLNIFYFVNRYFFYGEIVPYFSGSAFYYALLFLNSAALYMLNFRFRNHLLLTVLVTVTVCLIGLEFLKIDFMYLIAVPVLVNSVAHIKGKTNSIGKHGDFTYGSYVFSFPVQQILISAGVFNPYLLFVLTIMIVFPMAVLSWNFVEKRFLMLKYKVK